MKNRIVALSLLVSLFCGAENLTALSLSSSFDTTTTVGGKWQDITSGLTYHSMGKKRFSFKERTTQFTPWFKGNELSLKAGCGGVSFDGGFVAFLELGEITKQLETAMASIGMGVIVALVQTMPSIGKAFEDIQKLVRKMQQMQQNACQLTTAALAKTETLSTARDSAQGWVDDSLGNNAVNNFMKGSAKWLDDAMGASDCASDDKACKKAVTAGSVNTLLSGMHGNIHDDKCIGLDKNLCNIISVAIGNATSINYGSLKDILDNSKYGAKTLSAFTDKDATLVKIKYGLFGVLAVDSSTGFSEFIDVDNKIKKNVILKYLASNDINTPVSLKLEWIKPLNSIKKVLEFITGGDELSVAPKILNIPGNINLASIKYCPKASKTGGCESKTVSLQYLEFTNEIIEPITLEWEGLYTSTYKTVLHYLKKNSQALPTSPVGVFVPQGEKYLRFLKKKYRGRKNSDILYYVDILARANVYYAVKNLVTEVKNDLIDLQYEQTNSFAITQYINNAKEITKELDELLLDYSGDIAYVNKLNELFDSSEKTFREKKFDKNRR